MKFKQFLKEQQDKPNLNHLWHAYSILSSDAHDTRAGQLMKFFTDAHKDKHPSKHLQGIADTVKKHFGKDVHDDMIKHAYHTIESENTIFDDSKKALQSRDYHEAESKKLREKHSIKHPWEKGAIGYVPGYGR